eukprot:CAMPEP_0206456796 /NCGR_PEP_ID=MMETSP0324_2-20121206/22580_1 /ASSEMBLY_ACC=CAM_ASM_000836 /TAXON_ID=2866 /ORGANISM="Crypthecodinium cohnii, Strain Seligo" /LENGTH=44 /DNA_ID= /DNA_START= /DNA_END= /DNA_ORIENTATION=
MVMEQAADKPPETKLAPKKGQNSVLGLYLGNMFLKVSLKARLKA